MRKKLREYLLAKGETEPPPTFSPPPGAPAKSKTVPRAPIERKPPIENALKAIKKLTIINVPALDEMNEMVESVINDGLLKEWWISA